MEQHDIEETEDYGYHLVCPKHGRYWFPNVALESMKARKFCPVCYDPLNLETKPVNWLLRPGTAEQLAVTKIANEGVLLRAPNGIELYLTNDMLRELARDCL